MVTSTELYVDGSTAWITLPSSVNHPNPAWGVGSVSFDNKIFLISKAYFHMIRIQNSIFIPMLKGGFNGVEDIQDVIQFDTDLGQWKEVGKLSIGRRKVSASIVSDDVTQFCQSGGLSPSMHEKNGKFLNNFIRGTISKERRKSDMSGSFSISLH